MASGPGQGGGKGHGEGGKGKLPDELDLYVDKHVKYIQSLDTVRLLQSPFFLSFFPCVSRTNFLELQSLPVAIFGVCQ